MEQNSEKFLVIRDVKKSYGAHFTLMGVNLSVPKGSVFALLGMNGAGKTTLIKLILDLLKLQGGSISVFGHNHLLSEVRTKIAYIPEKFSFFSYYTVYEVLEFFCNCRGIKKEDQELVIQNALKRLNLVEIKNRKIKSFSKGQLQRVGLATLLIGDMDFFILDEPFSGLDPIGIKDLKDLIKEFKASEKTVFINSHILLEMENLADHFAIIHHGEILHQGLMNDLKSNGQSLEDFFTSKVNQS